MSVTVTAALADDADSSQLSNHQHPLRSHRGSPIVPFPDFQDKNFLPTRVMRSLASRYHPDHPRSRWSESTRDTAFDSIIDGTDQGGPVSPYSSFVGTFPSPRTMTGFTSSPLASPSSKDGFPVIPARPPLTPTLADPTFYEIDWKPEKTVVIEEAADVATPYSATTEISHLPLVIVLYLFTFMHGMNTTALAGLLSAFWTATIYLLSTVLLPPIVPSPSHPSVFKSMLLAGTATFAGGSALCALAPTYFTFLLGRILQGLSCGLCISFLTQSPSSSLSKRTYCTTLALTFWIGAAGAPLVGAALTPVKWRHMFWLSTGVGAVILTVTTIAQESVKLDIPTNGRRSTVWALALTSLILVSIAVGWTGTSHAWDSWPVLVPLISGWVLALAALIHACWRGQMYLRPLALLRSSTVLAQGLLFSGVVHLLPIVLRSTSTLHSVLKLVPLLAGIVISSALTSLLLPRLNQQIILTVSSLLTTTTTSLLLLIHSTSSISTTIPLLAFLGIAYGSLHSSTSSTLHSRPHALGMTLGLVLASSIYLNESSSSTPFRAVWITFATISATISVSQTAVAVWDVRYIRKACEK